MAMQRDEAISLMREGWTALHHTGYTARVSMVSPDRKDSKPVGYTTMRDMEREGLVVRKVRCGRKEWVLRDD